jgi:hypothetical protein
VRDGGRAVPNAAYTTEGGGNTQIAELLKISSSKKMFDYEDVAEDERENEIIVLSRWIPVIEAARAGRWELLVVFGPVRLQSRPRLRRL